jgi:uncharacterized surface protein with fasciclin (FAS1) repeats
MKRWIVLGVALALFLVAMPALTVGATEPKTDQSIVEALEEDGGFTALLDALEVSKLQAKLQSEGPYTFFAPSDDAFLKLHKEIDVDEIMEIYSQVSELLMHHVMTGTVMAADLTLLEQVPTLLNGSTLTVTVNADTIMLNDATLIKPDILASNGVIHIIDTILLVPPGEPITATTSGAGVWSSYDTVFPMPPDVQNFMGQGGETQVNFQTSLTLEELLNFYRTEAGSMGLVERTLLTVTSDQMFSIVFDSWPNGQALVIQSVDLGALRNVNVRLENT